MYNDHSSPFFCYFVLNPSLSHHLSRYCSPACNRAYTGFMLNSFRVLRSQKSGHMHIKCTHECKPEEGLMNKGPGSHCYSASFNSATDFQHQGFFFLFCFVSPSLSEMWPQERTQAVRRILTAQPELQAEPHRLAMGPQRGCFLLLYGSLSILQQTRDQGCGCLEE